MKLSSIAYVTSVFLLLSCGQDAPQKFDILLLNASLIDVQSAEVQPGKLVGIRKDTIRLVSDMDQAGQFEAGVTIDAAGNYILPGLWDMHVHFRGGDSLIEENRDLLPLFLAYGVTTVRDAGGDMTPAVLAWRQAIRNGQLAGPDIFTSGPKFDGPDPAWEGSIPLASPDDVGTALDSLVTMGVDYIKNYDGSLSRESYYELIRQAESRGLKMTGHMPLQADLLKAMELGLDGIEHLYYLLPASSAITDSLKLSSLGYQMLPALLEAYDPQKARNAMEQLGKGEFYVTPTLYIGQILAGLKVDDHSGDSLLPRIGPGIRNTYEMRINRARAASPEYEKFDKELEKWFGDRVLPLQEAGVNLLAGSDCGPFNSFVYPGESLHGELRMLVANGLTPAQALKTSIINGPKFFDLEAYYGSIEEGKVAHLLLLKKNPLEDLHHLGSLEQLIKDGKIYRPADLR